MNYISLKSNGKVVLFILILFTSSVLFYLFEQDRYIGIAIYLAPYAYLLMVNFKMKNIEDQKLTESDISDDELLGIGCTVFYLLYIMYTVIVTSNTLLYTILGIVVLIITFTNKK